MLRGILIFGLATALASPAAAQFYKPTDGHVHMTRQEVDLQYEGQLDSFRRKALAMRQADGGTLSPAHLAVLQAKLDRLNRSYQTELQAINQ